MYFVYEQLLDIADKDFKSSVINMFNKLREKYPNIQSIKESLIKVNEQMRNRNRELKTSTKCICK